MKVAISGASGLIGSALRPVLEAAGHETVALVRSGGDASDPQGIRWDPYEGMVDAPALEGCDAVVNLSGTRIRAGRWTDKHKRAVLESRTRTTRFLADALASLDSPPKVMLSASAVGFYGERGDEELTEDAANGDGFLADLCAAWEAATAPAERAGVRVTQLRTGLVLSSEGGLLDPFILPGRLVVSGRLGSGRQWMSWISIDDHVGAITHLLGADLSGPVNLAAPNPVRNREFVQTLSRVLGRPKLPPVPAFALRLLFGREAAEEAALVSQRVVPERLATSGFRFHHTELGAALEHVLSD